MDSKLNKEEKNILIKMFPKEELNCDDSINDNRTFVFNSARDLIDWLYEIQAEDSGNDMEEILKSVLQMQIKDNMVGKSMYEALAEEHEQVYKVNNKYVYVTG